MTGICGRDLGLIWGGFHVRKELTAEVIRGPFSDRGFLFGLH